MLNLLTTDEVAEILKVHKVTIQRMCKAGKLKAAKLGKSYRIEKLDLEEFIKTQKIEQGIIKKEE